MINAVDLHCLARYFHLRRTPLLPLLLRKAIQYLHGSYLPPEAEIGSGTELGYGGLGVIVHPQARIGRDCFISPQVTLGGRSDLPGAPILERGVRVGVGAKILGPVRIGAGARIGANAVVIHDVPPGATVVGVPARATQARAPTHGTARRNLALPEAAAHPELTASVLSPPR